VNVIMPILPVITAHACTRMELMDATWFACLEFAQHAWRSPWKNDTPTSSNCQWDYYYVFGCHMYCTLFYFLLRKTWADTSLCPLRVHILPLANLLSTSVSTAATIYAGVCRMMHQCDCLILFSFRQPAFLDKCIHEKIPRRYPYDKASFF
jgi:hypothetical protein